MAHLQSDQTLIYSVAQEKYKGLIRIFETGVNHYDYNLQQEMDPDVFKDVDAETRKKYLYSKRKFVTGRIRVDGGNGKHPEYEPVFRTMEEMVELMASKGLDFDPMYEIRTAEIYANPQECGEVIRILEDEAFPLKKEYRLAVQKLEELKAVYAVRKAG